MEAMDTSGEKIQIKDGSALSPTSSSSPSQSSADRNFEPTIDMMVNDFDDDETLQEEEAIAALEYQNPQDEIDRLREESEMPIEELLARYGSMPAAPPPPVNYYAKKKSKKTANASNKRAKTATVQVQEAKSPIQVDADADSDANADGVSVSGDVIVIESGDEETDQLCKDKQVDEDACKQNEPINEQECDEVSSSTEIPKKRRTHLMDLYPEENFNAADEESGGNGDMDDDENEEGEEEDEEETDDDDDVDSSYVKKTIMVGSAYQAAIPIGLSQYGDILPYENEDKLVWEPSQVSEREVEDYLMKASEIKPALSESNQADENSERTTTVKEGTSTSTSTPNERLPRPNAQKEAAPRNETQDTRDAQSVTSSIDGDGAVVKDNEQALHLLVQCGYDFKEALRRKRLNAVPLTGSMSLWSDDECSKFEEGIQKFGKDFLKIRQNQVRTRTMRELVQFYYLWKKSERRDQNFANSNTVDHMDIYLDEGSEFGSNAASQPASASLTLNTRKHSTSMQNNFSILTGSNASLTTNNAPSQTSATVSAMISNNRRRSTTGTATTTASGSATGANDNQNNSTTNSNNIRNDVNTLSATGKQT